MGPLKTLPYLVMFLMSNAGGWTGDALILKQHKSVAAARKAVNTLGTPPLAALPHTVTGFGTMVMPARL
jgi:ACS family sodium-dependent inorganic phosphate cotransporter